VETDVELDEQARPQPAAGERLGQPCGRRHAVDRDRQLDPRRDDVGQALPLVRAERRVVDEDRRRPRLLEHLRLARLRDREAAGAELELTPPDLGGLVGLRVRPELDAVRVDVRLQLGEVRFQAVEVDDRDRRLDLAQGTADLASE
jgi:hypothetical protein